MLEGGSQSDADNNVAAVEAATACRKAPTACLKTKESARSGKAGLDTYTDSDGAAAGSRKKPYLIHFFLEICNFFL